MVEPGKSIGFSPSYGLNVCEEDARLLTGPFQVSLDITNRCNLRCKHCYNASGENYIAASDELTDLEVLKLATDIAAMKPMNFCFCGGEPLLRKDLLMEAAKILKSGCRFVSMVTNGYLVTSDIAQSIVASGVERLQVSIDGARPETHERLRGKKGAFIRAVNAINAFKEAGAFDVEIAFCPTAFNIHEFPAIYDLCKRLEIKNIRVQPLMLLGRTNRYLNELQPTNSQYRELVSIIAKYRIACNGPNIEWGDPIDHLIRFRTLISPCVPFISIKANGSIVASPYLPLTIGNIRNHSVAEYWNAGLIGVWQHPIVQTFAERIQSVPDYCKAEEGMPVIWLEKDIELDLIDSPEFQKEMV